MDFHAAKQLGTCLSREYSESLFRLLVNYNDISASEAASRLGIHIRTAQDFLDTLAALDILSKEEVYERKRPYNRYSLAQKTVSLQIDLDSLFRNDATEDDFDRPIRERRGSGARFTTARGGDSIAAVSTWSGRGRDGAERRISLTAPQGRFLYHLPFPTAAAMPVSEIMQKADVGEEHQGEIADLINVLTDLNIIETV